MKLTVSLDYDDLSRALREINAYKKSFNAKVDEFLRRLCEYGADIAQEQFNTDRGKNPIPNGLVMVGYEKVEDNVYRLIANGEQVCFLEFGTGVYAGNGHPYAKTAPVKVYPGSYSEDHGGTYADWINKGAQGEYRFNGYPTYAMLTAYNMMKDYALELAREVFQG